MILLTKNGGSSGVNGMIKKKNNGKAVQLQKPNSHCLLYFVAANSLQVEAKGKRKRKDTRTKKDKREKRKQDDNK